MKKVLALTLLIGLSACGRDNEPEDIQQYEESPDTQDPVEEIDTTLQQ